MVNEKKLYRQILRYMYKGELKYGGGVFVQKKGMRYYLLHYRQSQVPYIETYSNWERVEILL